MARGLLMTVGGSKESEIFCIMQTDPEYVALLCTPGSRDRVDTIVQETALRPSQYQVWEVPDSADSVGRLVHEAHAAHRWLEEHCSPEAQITINPTAGRKWMSIGLSLFASRTSARQVYVDVDYPDGRPDPETMKLKELGNAQDHTGLLDADLGVELFNRSDFEGAARVFERIAPKLAAARELYRGLKSLCEALHRWDRFEHYGGGGVAQAAARDAETARSAASELGMSRVAGFATQLKALAGRIREVETGPKPSLLAVVDLLHNAKRRIAAGRYDDAVARLYRALEATGQYLLSTRGMAATGVNWNKVPENAQEAFLSASNRKCLPKDISLRDGFLLVRALGAEEAGGFFEPAGKKGFTYEKHLQPRNNSILAHGWEPAAQDKARKFAEQLSKDIQALGGDLSGWDIPIMPRLWT